jgi:type VI secretion system protein ImpJ
MLLCPQHFQQNDLRIDASLARVMALTSPFAWGFSSLSIDATDLARGRFRIPSCEAVLPNGSIVSFRESPTDTFELDLKKTFPEGENVTTIHLVIPRFIGENYSRGTDPCFQSKTLVSVTDLHSGETPLDIPILQPALRLLAGEINSGKFHSLAVAKVRREGETFSLEAFCPPSLFIETGSVVFEACQALAEKLRKKTTTLLEKLSVNQLVQHIEAEMRTQAVMLTSQLATLEALLAVERNSPFTLYQTLCSLAGTVSALLNQTAPPVLPRYVHGDPLPHFKNLIASISQALDAAIVESYQVVRSTWDEGQQFHIKLYDGIKVEELLIGLRKSPGMSDEALHHWMDTVLIASRSKVAHMRDLRILGPARTRLTHLDGLIPPKDVLLFRLENTATAIRIGEALVFHQVDSQAVRPLEVILYSKPESVKAPTSQPSEIG